jgi:phage-related protein
VLKALMPIIQAVANIFLDILTPAIHTITDVLGGIIDFLTGVFTGNWNKVWKGIGEIFGGIWNGLIGIVKGVVNGIIDLIDGVIKGVNSIGGAVGIKIGVIPHLAEGATVLPTPGGTIVRVAEGGKAESVVDTGKLNKLIDKATSSQTAGGNTFNIYGATDENKTAVAVVRRLGFGGV